MSNDLISRSALLEEYCRQNECLQNHSGDCLICFGSDVIKTAPAVDAVIPVRCKDCEHGRKSDHAYAVDTAKPLCECNFMYGPHQWHEYCSWGKRRADK